MYFNNNISRFKAKSDITYEEIEKSIIIMDIFLRFKTYFESERRMKRERKKETSM